MRVPFISPEYSRLYPELAVRMVFGMLSGAAVGYICVLTPLILRGRPGEEHAFEAILSGLAAGAAAGVFIGVYFVTGAIRKTAGNNDIVAIRAIYKELFYSARSGRRALALREAFTPAFTATAVKAAAALCAHYDEGAALDRNKRLAAAGLARFMRAAAGRSAQVRRLDQDGYEDIVENIASIIRPEEMRALIAYTGGVTLSDAELARYYRAHFPAAPAVRMKGGAVKRAALTLFAYGAEISSGMRDYAASLLPPKQR